MSRLVTVIIVTYNSSSFIEETLDSVFRQTWSEIELIITDDSSKDNTVSICDKWLSKFSYRFANCRLLTSEVNTGTSGNANRGLYAASGEWIKFLGGDDALINDCISDNMSFVERNSNIGVLFSRVNRYDDFFSPNNLLDTTPVGPILQESILWPLRTAESQYRMLLLGDRINFSPSFFIKKDVLLKIGGFDERFRLLEDYPLWLKLTKNGHKLFFMDKITVNYRQHKKAVNHTAISFIVNPNYFNSESFRRECVYPFLPPIVRFEQKFRWVTSQLFRIDFMNRPTYFNKLLYNAFTVYLNPFRYLNKLKRIIRKEEDEF